MHTRVLTVLSLFFIFFSAGFSQFQPTEVIKSVDKIIIENKVYYIHIVKEGHTLYSISRVYNVPQKEILLENPNAFIGLQPGQALKIPFQPETSQEELFTGEPGEDFIFHTVEPGQTLFFLSRNYDVEMEEIARLNPGVEEGLQVSQVVKIPAMKVYITREGFPAEDDNYIHHKVEQGETLYSLSRKYEVPIRSIRRANDKLFWGLKYGEYIRIPKFTEEEPEDNVIAEIPLDRIAAKPLPADIFDMDAVIDAECASFNYLEYNRPFNVALMLPLYIDRNFPAEVSGAIEQKETGIPGQAGPATEELYRETIPFLEFYEGALLAVESLVGSGVSINLRVIDTERNPALVQQIIREPGFNNMDLIIGPVYPENMKIVADWARWNQVNVVSPLTSRTELLAGNPYLFQVTPSASVELEQASLFITNFPTSNFVLIHKNDQFENNMVNSFKNHIFRHFSYSSGYDNLVFKEVIYTSPTVNIGQSLVAGEKNIVIIPSADQAFVSDVLMRLNVLSRTYDITIFGLQEWQRFANLEVEYLHNMELHFASPYFIDYNNRNVKDFLGRFRNKYKTDPSYYGFQGYDIMFYFLQALKNYGPDFHECLPLIRTELLQADFLFRKSDIHDGFENNGITIVKYDKDMSIRRLGLNSQMP
jgi:LysM repeat protein